MIAFACLQIDAMLMWLHINRGSVCSGLLLSNHLDFPISVIPYLGTLQKSLLGEAFEAPTFCHYFERDPDFANLPRKGSQILATLTRTNMADENIKVSTPPSDDF